MLDWFTIRPIATGIETMTRRLYILSYKEKMNRGSFLTWLQIEEWEPGIRIHKVKSFTRLTFMHTIV